MFKPSAVPLQQTVSDQPLTYQPSANFLDEVYSATGEIKPDWQYLLNSLAELGAAAFSERHAKALRILRDDGATYTIYGDHSSPAQTWGLDLVPAIVSSEEWAKIEAGLLERAELLNLLLRDIYGPRNLIRHGVIPPEALFIHPGFLRACHGTTIPGEHELIMHAADMVRTQDGGICVLTDRTQAPSGAGYALENRTVMSRVLPSLFRDSHVHRLAPFFQRLRNKLISLSTSGDLPRVVVLTPGAQNETYFEHAYLANYLGFPLVQSGDLQVRNGFVWMRSLAGLGRVDVILRRVDDWFCDPVELRSDSQLGVPGLLEAVRAKRVVITNPLGSGILENPILLKFLPAISKTLLGREPRLPSIKTYWCADPEDMQYITDNLQNLVIKPVYRSTNNAAVWGQDLTAEQREQWLALLLSKPQEFVAQEALYAAHIPAFKQGRLQPRPAILRGFAVAAESSYTVMPGGLTRVGTQEGARLISNQLGALSKDTWVTASEPERSGDVIPKDTQGATEAQLISLPSRVVENLFWMGRYAERAEALLRLLRTVFVLLNGEEPISQLSRQLLLRAVTDITATHPGFVDAPADLLANPEQELLLVLKDGNRSGTVRAILNSMLFSAEESKELLSSDTLRVINDIHDAIDNLDTSLATGLTSAPEEALDPLVTALMALSGLAQESMTRGIGWRFMDIGRRLERSLQTIAIVRTFAVSDNSELEQHTLLNALLLTLEVLITYRRRYRARLRVDASLELVILDADNPRSLLFQFQQLKQHIAALPREHNHSSELSSEERALLEIVTTTQLSHLSNLIMTKDGSRYQLEQLLRRLENLLMSLSDVISDKYFDHRVGPQQLVQTNWGQTNEVQTSWEGA